MSYKVAFQIESVERGDTVNWLVFNTYIDALSKTKLFTFKYCGTEIVHSLSLKDSVIKNLLEALNNDFGFAPYDIDKCKKVIGIGKQYIVKG